MATSWQEILDLGQRADRTGSSEAESEGERRGVFRRLRQSLSKSRKALTEELSASFFDRIDGETWERLEEALILADAGAPTTAKVVERLEHEVEAGTVPADGEAVQARLISKQMPGAPHETLLSIDATTGQNGLRQAKIFAEAAEVDGVVLTKLDGTAKGGIVLAIADELGIPVKLIGTGETLEDLRPFDPTDFANALLTDG